MKRSVLTKDVMDWSEALLAKLTERYDKNYREFLDVKERKESSLLYRIFRLTYDPLWMHNAWEWMDLKMDIDDIKELQSIALYNYGANIELTELPEYPRWIIPNFYNWTSR